MAHPADSRRNDHPAFLITIDTEGDNLWSCGPDIRTQNSLFLPRFQELCERYGFFPTYLVNYEMARDPCFIEFGRDILSRHCGEIGMHLHAWNSPPLTRLTDDDFRYRPYLIEYPGTCLAEKISVMTDLLSTTFDTKIVSHRAGRWAFNETYARELVRHNYLVDCSVTPWVSWKSNLGKPDGAGGTDYSRFPEDAYRIDLSDISRSGNSTLIELPMSIQPSAIQKAMPQLYQSRWVGRILRKLGGLPNWMRPNGSNLQAMLDVADQIAKEQRRYLQFMLHSSEFMPGGSPTFKDENSIEKLYDDLQGLFEFLSPRFQGKTLKNFAESVAPSL